MIIKVQAFFIVFTDTKKNIIFIFLCYCSTTTIVFTVSYTGF